MAANINDKFSEVSTGTRPATTTVANVRSVSGSSLVCDDLTGWTTDTAVHFVTYELDGQGNVVPGTQQDMKGIVSGNTIGSIVVTGGTDIGNKVGDVVQQLPTAAWAKDLADGLLVSHDADGSLSAGIVNTTELANEAVTTAKIDDGAVTANKIDFTTFQAPVTGTLTISSTGSKTVTLGFKPRLLLLNAVATNSDSANMSATGYFDGTNISCMTSVTTSDGSASRKYTNRFSLITYSVGTTSTTMRTDTFSFTATGFTYNVQTSSSTTEIDYVAYP